MEILKVLVLKENATIIQSPSPNSISLICFVLNAFRMEQRQSAVKNSKDVVGMSLLFPQICSLALFDFPPLA